MNFRIASILLFVLFISCKQENIEVSTNEEKVAIIPIPDQILKKDGYFSITEKTNFFCNDEELKTLATFFIEKIEKSIGVTLGHTEDKKDNSIHLAIDENLSIGEEGYHFFSSKEEVTITAKTPKGVFYGLQTLLQLLPTDPSQGAKIPSVEIKDSPAFDWRGMHLDVSRHFFSIDFIKKQLDVLALFKINKFHWHLTDDQGWRIEIKKYPKLTEISSVRQNKDKTIHKGYYTQEQIKEVVAYAKERFIDVIPEFDTPGHAVAILEAYPELACEKKDFKVRNLWGVESNILCAGKEETFSFIGDVVSELAALFPYEYFHMGGDEVPKDEWKKSLHCQNVMKKENLKDVNELQSYFMKRVEDILKSHNKKMIGWDEILEGGITPTTNIMSWQGEEGGIKAANAGHDVIMTPSKYVYLNFYQGDLKVEPMAFGGYIPLETIYNYNPIPKEIQEDKRKHILGAQANVWTEYADKDETIEYLLYPRIIALAELTWTSSEKKDYKDFLSRLNNVYPRLDKKQINYHIPLPEGPTSDHIVFTDSVEVSFKTTHPVKMVYTVDKTDPNGNSTEYTKPILLKEDTDLSIASILPHGKMSKVRRLLIRKQKLLKSMNLEKVSSGLQMKVVKGYFQTVTEAEKTIPQNTVIINNLKDANKTYDWGHKVNDDNFRAVFLEGYIEVPEDEVYYFSSTQDQVWIGDQLLINHNDAVRKHPKENSIALQKGKHKLKIIYLNTITQCWATDWNTVELKYRKASEEEYQAVGERMIFH